MSHQLAKSALREENQSTSFGERYRDETLVGFHKRISQAPCNTASPGMSIMIVLQNNHSVACSKSSRTNNRWAADLRHADVLCDLTVVNSYTYYEPSVFPRPRSVLYRICAASCWYTPHFRWRKVGQRDDDCADGWGSSYPEKKQK